VKANYEDGDDYAICLCPVGERWRIATNNGKPCLPFWKIWAHEQGIPFEKVRPIEDVLTPEELSRARLYRAHVAGGCVGRDCRGGSSPAREAAMTDPSPFVQRCMTALAEYDRLRDLGVGHEMAMQDSGFYAAIVGKPVDVGENMRDVRRICAGDTE
jgi:hypothetical protein